MPRRAVAKGKERLAGTSSDPYADPRLYDALHARGTPGEARSLLKFAGLFAPGAEGPWLEPACGTGRLLIALAKLGELGVGVELHPAMAAYARDRVRRAGLARRVRIVEGDMRDVAAAARLKPRSVRAAFCLDNSVRHLPSDAAMVDHLRSVARVLNRGGAYFVGLSLTPEGGGFPSEHVAGGRIGRTPVRQVVEFLPPGPGSRVEWALCTVSVGDRVLTARYPLRTSTIEQWARVVHRAGLREAAVVGMDGRPLGDGRTAYAVRVLLH